MGKVSEIINSKPIESLTSFFSEIVGKPLVDGAGYLYADAIRTKRIANTIKLEEKYKLKRTDDLQPTTLAFGYKLLDKASLEDNDGLLDKWANLLSNATDKNYMGSMRKIYIDILENLEPLDVQLFDNINQFCLSSTNKYSELVSLKNNDHLNKEALNVLLSLGLITYGVSVTQGISIGGNAPTTFHGLSNFRVTELGQEFYKAVHK
jgi:hypothetical protein